MLGSSCYPSTRRGCGVTPEEEIWACKFVLIWSLLCFVVSLSIQGSKVHRRRIVNIGLLLLCTAPPPPLRLHPHPAPAPARHRRRPRRQALHPHLGMRCWAVAPKTGHIAWLCCGDGRLERDSCAWIACVGYYIYIMCDIYVYMCVYACVHAACVDASTRRAHVHGCLCSRVRKRQYRHIERHTNRQAVARILCMYVHGCVDVGVHWCTSRYNHGAYMYVRMSLCRVSICSLMRVLYTCVCLFVCVFLCKLICIYVDTYICWKAHYVCVWLYMVMSMAKSMYFHTLETKPSKSMYWH